MWLTFFFCPARTLMEVLSPDFLYFQGSRGHFSQCTQEFMNYKTHLKALHFFFLAELSDKNKKEKNWCQCVTYCNNDTLKCKWQPSLVLQVMGANGLNGTSAAAVTVLTELTHGWNTGRCLLIERPVRGQNISAVCVYNQMSVHQAHNSKSKHSKPGTWQDLRVVPLRTERSEDKQAGSHMTSF